MKFLGFYPKITRKKKKKTTFPVVFQDLGKAGEKTGNHPKKPNARPKTGILRPKKIRFEPVWSPWDSHEEEKLLRAPIWEIPKLYF